MATHTIDLDEAKACLAELIDEAQAGDQVIITRGEQPIARILPIARQQPVQWSGPRAGSARGMVTISDDFDAPLEEFEPYTS